MVAHIIGDSHACFFSGYDVTQLSYPEPAKNKYAFFRGYRLGSVLAYNLINAGTSEKGREKLFELLKEINKEDLIFLHFGEIDCRCHLLKQADLQKKALESIVEGCVNNYLKVIEEIKALGYNVGVIGVIPSAESNNPEFPTYGSMIDRNRSSVLFNKYLEEKCNASGIVFISLFKYLIAPNQKSKTQYYFDSIHLSQLGMPFAIKEFSLKFPKLVSPYYSDFQIDIKIHASKFVSFLKLINRKIRKTFTRLSA